MKTGTAIRTLAVCLSTFVILHAANAQVQAPPSPPVILQAPIPEPESPSVPIIAQSESLLGASLNATSGPVTTWLENADSLAEVVTTPSSPGYSMLQTNIVAEGSGAFRLANVAFANQYIELSPTIQPTANSKLYFQGRLGYATSAQTAHVQVRPSSGGNWTSIWTLQGTGGLTQNGFQLESISLASYAGQSIRIRFALLFTGGSAFTDADFATVGWFVDDVQIGSSFLAQLYQGVGQPTAEEILAVEYINRARADAVAEASRLRNTNDPDVQNAISYFGVNLDLMEQQFAALTRNLPPLAINAKLTAAARLHSQDMYNNMFQGHVSSNNPPAPNQPGDSLGNRISRQGYSYGYAGENVYSYARSIWHSHAGFNIDWGNGTGGMQTPAGHRLNIHSSNFTELGVGVVLGSNGSVGPILITHDLASGNSLGGPFLVGVTYKDEDSDGFYSLGEGIGGVSIRVEGAAFRAESSTEGAYALPLPGNGNYTVTFEHPGHVTLVQQFAVTNSASVKIDYLASLETSNYVTIISTNISAAGKLQFRFRTNIPQASIQVLSSTDLIDWTRIAHSLNALGDNTYMVELDSAAEPLFYMIGNR